MTDRDCVMFLQWALPKLRMRWQGFRKVRGKVCKRVAARIRDLDLADIAAYRTHLEQHPDEWRALDPFCRITISRFYRDHEVFQFLEREVLPHLALDAVSRGEQVLRCWSIGCASGEEPYTLALLWDHSLAQSFPALDLSVAATDADPDMIGRAQAGCYPPGSMRELPREWTGRSFTRSGSNYCLQEQVKKKVTFLMQDVRAEAPEGPFHLVLCRNVAFTYFGEGLQRDVLERVRNRLARGGALVIGKHESLPDKSPGWTAWSRTKGIYRIEQ